ncbi:MAG: hypothetical protein MHM6MM_006909, partial [Cercozoa sp. M6MM]
MLCLLLALVGVATALATGQENAWRVGFGKADVTGPVAELVMMGYAQPSMKAAGLHTRLFARASVFQHEGKTVAIVSADLGQIFVATKAAIVAEICSRLQPEPCPFTEENTMLSATHTHSGPGGYAQRPLYDLGAFPSLFNAPNFDKIVRGTARAVVQAFRSLTDASICVAHGRLPSPGGKGSDIGINRSERSYYANPEELRAKYDTDVDDFVVHMRVDSAVTRENLGTLTWASTHGTSMNNTNLLVSADNKGYAAQLFEEWQHNVALFLSSSLGDVSPNTLGAFCPDGRPCHEGGVCDSLGRIICRGIGPGEAPPTNGTQEDSAKIIGERQFFAARDLFRSCDSPQYTGDHVKNVETRRITNEAKLDFRHRWTDMERVEVPSDFTATGKVEKTCRAAFGAAFAAGTTDGQGATELGFRQGETYPGLKTKIQRETAQRLTRAIPTSEDKRCHRPKPIFLATTSDKLDTDWTPRSLPMQLFRFGDFLVAAGAQEVTTMAGRMLRERIALAYSESKADTETVVAWTGLANGYASYLTTYWEYQLQRYEAASTLFGQHQHALYLQYFSDLAKALAKQGPPSLPQGTPQKPCETSLCTVTQLPNAPVDTLGSGDFFGQRLSQTSVKPSPGDTVRVEFVGANPRHT